VIAGRTLTKLEQARDRLGGGTIQVLGASLPERVARFFAEIGPFDHLVLSLSGGGGGGTSGRKWIRDPPMSGWLVAPIID
jgi:hypothetical protein